MRFHVEAFTPDGCGENGQPKDRLHNAEAFTTEEEASARLEWRAEEQKRVNADLLNFYARELERFTLSEDGMDWETGAPLFAPRYPRLFRHCFRVTACIMLCGCVPCYEADLIDDRAEPFKVTK